MRTYPYFSPAQLSDIWDRWHDGQTQTQIAEHFDVKPVYIFYRLRLHGGIRPEEKKARSGALTLEEREEISRYLAASSSIRQIAESLGRAPSTISREIAKNGGVRRYRAAKAHKMVVIRASRPKQTKLASSHRLLEYVAMRLEQDWSPEQIEGELKVAYPDDSEMRISHETIYKSLYIQARGELKKELTRHLRTHRVMRKSKQAGRDCPARSTIKEGLPIAARPSEADDRAIPGHWEGDLIIGSHVSQVATLVERASRFTMLVKCPKRDALSVKEALAQKIRDLPGELRRSLTWDRGSELAQHKQLSIDAEIAIYFCDPKSPWQRGSNENTNGLLRQYLPKKTDLANYSQAELDAIAEKLNTRPRKTLGFKTPAAKLEEVLS